MKITDAIKTFLLARKAANTDLIDRIMQHWPDLECQVNVKTGEPTDKSGVFTDDTGLQFHNIRIPKKANSEPEFNDYEMSFPLEEYAQGIGFTGWDWKARCSRWVGFDFDGITHANGLSDEALEAVKKAVQALPYVQIRKSKSGKGLHLYVYLDGVQTANHTEHAALARAVLAVMSKACDFDFTEYVDCCGSILWVWHRDMTADGMALVKAATTTFSSLDLPDDWKDSAGVKKTKQTPLDDLIGKTKAEPLDSEHRAIIEALQKSGYATNYDAERHLVNTHTKALQDLAESGMGIRGLFKTISTGSHPGTPNCFMFPLPGGGFQVYRFSPGTTEAETWTTSKDGWTTCTFNQTPPLAEAIKLFGGMDVKKNQFFFEDIQQIAQAVALVGKQFEVPEAFQGRGAHLTLAGDTMKITMKKERGDERPKGWAVTPRGNEFVKTLAKPVESKEENVLNHDDEVRATTMPDGTPASWMINTDAGWLARSLKEIQLFLSKDYEAKEVGPVISQFLRKPWTHVTRPFEAEYPGHRQWNRGAPQYAFEPVEGPHPHWDMVLNHCFGSLDRVIVDDLVCQQLGITSGYQYGLFWIASILQTPYQPLPYLFFHGVENCGKSTLHDAFKLLVTKGCVEGDAAVKGKDNFNGELEGAILVFIEEVNIANTPGVMDRLKKWITNQEVMVRNMYKGQCEQRNTRHFVQMANRVEYCPVEPNDTRITMIYVPPLGDAEIQSQELATRLRDESPHFLFTALNTELPMYKRLRLPIVSTATKEQLQATRQTPLEQFLAEHCVTDADGTLLHKDFYRKFVEWLGEEAEDYLPEKTGKTRLSKELPKEISQPIVRGYRQLRGIKWKEKI
jgi:hypothetical protein